MKFTRWTAKFIIIGVFLFILAYANRESIPLPRELITLDFITAGGIDINAGEFSLSYLSSESANPDNSEKNILNVKARTLHGAREELQNVTNRTVTNSHLSYIIIGEQTARESLGDFIAHYARSPGVRLDVNAFIARGMTGEEFLEKALTSDINVNARIDSMLRDKAQVSSYVGRSLKDLLQIYYSRGQVGLIPVLEIIESPPEQKAVAVFAEEEEQGRQSGEDQEGPGYTFTFYGLGIIKGGRLAGLIERGLVRTYIMLTGSLRTGAVEVTDDDGELSVFSVKNSSSKISFEIDGRGRPVKANFDIRVDVNFDEARGQALNEARVLELSGLVSEHIKLDVARIVQKSKDTGADFLRIGEAFAARHPHRHHAIRDDWQEIFSELEYAVRVNTTIKRYFNISR